MHAVLVTFSTSLPAAPSSASFRRHVGELASDACFVGWTSIADGSLLGGLLLFSDGEAADSYLAGDHFHRLRQDPSSFAFEVRRFLVLDDVRVSGRDVL